MSLTPGSDPELPFPHENKYIITTTDTRVIEMVANDEVVYTLSQRADPRTQMTSSLIQAWAIDSGDLLWDFAPIPSGESSSSAGGGAVRSALLLDEKHLRVLDNTQSDHSASASSSLFVLDANKGTVLVQMVSTDLVDFLPAEQQQEEDVQLVFLQLLEGLEGTSSGSSHVLSGCLSLPVDDTPSSTSNSAASVGCQFTFVLDLKLTGLKKEGSRAPAPIPRLQVFPGFPSVTHYSQVQARIVSTSSSFGPEDTIIAASTVRAEVTVSAVMLASQSRVVGVHSQFFTSGAETGSMTVSPVLLALSDTPAPLLAVSVCSTGMEGAACAAHVVEVKGGETTSSSVQFRELVACNGASSVLSFERMSASSNMAAAAVCVSLSGGSSVSAGTCAEGGSVSPMTLTAQCANEVTAVSSSLLTASFSYAPTLTLSSPNPSSSMTKLQAAFVYRYKVMASGEERLKVLALSSTGSLSMFQKRGDQKGSATMQWTREEALARVVDSVILDGVSLDHISHERVESLGGSMPTFETRLRMQFLDLQDMLLGWAAQLQLTELGNLFKDLGQKSTGVDRSTLEAFGFNKVSVMFTSVCVVDTSSFSPGTTFPDTIEEQQQGEEQQCLDGLKVFGLDLITGDVLWTFEPVVTPFLSLTAAGPYHLFGRLLNVRPHVRGSHGPEITLLLSVENVDDGQTTLLTYSFNPHTGEVTGTRQVCEGTSSSSQRLPSSIDDGLGQVSSVQLYNGDARGHEETNTFLLVHKTSVNPTGPPLVSLFPHMPSATTTSPVSNSKQREVYTQVCVSNSDRHASCASLVSYRVNFQEPLAPPVGSSSRSPTLYPTKVIGSVVFNKQESSESASGSGDVVGESVVAVQYPSAGDPVHSRAKVLGDNSLLIKYLNPHLVVVITEKLQRSERESESEREGQGGALSSQSTEAGDSVAGGGAEGGISLAGEDTVTDQSGTTSSSAGSDSAGGEQQQVPDDEQHVDEIFVNVIDTVSAQIVHRYSILHASTRMSGRASVQVSWIENNLLVSYWSNQAQRQELSSVSLFEGMIDKYGLGPFSSIKVDQIRSSFNAPAPIALQKTFILPRKVTSMHHTVTSRGITNKNLLLGLGGGQLYTIDLRMLDPRRPINKPTPAEMEEKLMQYVPFIPLHPFQMLSTNSTLPPVQRILSSPSKLESTSIVMTLGLDVYHTRTVPSKGFDMLASDFNKPLLTLILVSMGAAVAWLRRAYKKQLLSSGWK